MRDHLLLYIYIFLYYRVYVRVRPLPDGKQAEQVAWKISQDKSSIAHVDTDKEPYVLDTVFDQNDSTKHIYDMTTKRLIREVVDGFNSTVFAYGQTSSGKTHTMRGTDSDPGIIPLAIRELFDIISKEDRDFLVRVSYMEIYNEDIRDLLVPGEEKLTIKQGTDGIVISGLKEETVTTLEEVMSLVELGDTQRHVGETKMNARSSRSHAIFRMAVESRSASSSGVRMSALNLVDLAGSERISKTGAEGQRKKEGAAINKSLLTLGTVISKLSEGASHVPYRDSKLTRILQSSLGGNAKTAMICAITPAMEHVDESHCSLAFACRAKTIVNNASVNEVLSDSALLRKQAKEIEELKTRLQMGHGGHIDENAVRRKIQSITRMLLDKQHTDEAHSNHVLSREARRKTWCPEVHTQKRQAEDPCPTKNGKLRRTSDGHLMLEGQVDRMMSMHHTDIATTLAQSMEDTGGSLQHKVTSLQKANSLLQKQLDATTHALHKKREELRATEDGMKKMAEEKGSVLPALKEAQWKNRQLEKDAMQHKERLEEALEKLKVKETEYSTLLEEKESQLREALERASQMEPLGSHVESGSVPTKELIDVRAELDTLRVKYERALESKENLSNELDAKCDEVEQLRAQLTHSAKVEDKSHRHEQDMLEEIERLKAHVADLEKRKRAPLYQKKQDAELEAAKARAAEAETRAEQLEEDANEAKEQVRKLEKNIDALQKDYEAKIIDVTDESLALSKKLDAAMEAAAGHRAQEADVQQISHLQQCIEEKNQVIESIESDLERVKSESKQLRAQLEEVQACADAASAHVRFLEDKAEQEDHEANACIQKMEDEHQEKIRAMEMALRHQEDLCEKSKLDLNALETENASLKDRNDSLEKRIELASSTLNAVDELKDLRKKHKEEVAKLNAQIRQATVGSKGNERAAERAAKDTNRLKNQIQDLETKLKKAVAEKSALQSEKAALDREHRSAKASLEKLNKNANRAAAVEERKRQPIVKELEDTKSKLSSVEEELYECKASLDRSEEKAKSLEETLESEQSKVSDLEAALEEHKQELEELNTRYDDLDCVCREKQQDLESAHAKVSSTEEALKDVNKQVAKLNEQIRGLKSNLDQATREKQGVQDHLESIQQDKKSLEHALSEAETRVEMMDALQMDLDSEKAHVITLQQNFEIMEKGLEDHKKELESCKVKNACLDEELTTARKGLAEKEEYISSLEHQVNDLMAKSMEMEASLEAAKGEYKKTKGLLSQAENAIEEHEKTITEVHAGRVKVEKELKETTERCRKLEQELQSRTEEFDGKMKAMEEASKHEKSSMEELQSATKALETTFEEERSNLHQQIDGLKERVQALQSSLQVAEKDSVEKQSTYDAERLQLVSRLEAAKEEHGKALETLQQELEESKQAACTISARIKEKEDDIQELKMTVEKLKSQSSILNEEKKAALDVTASLKAETECLRQEMERLRQEMQQKATVPDSNLGDKVQALEKELRRSKRREEKLQALQYRLQQDVQKAGGSMEAFKNLRDVRSLEYELDRTANKAEKEIQALKKALAATNCSRNPLVEKNS